MPEVLYKYKAVTNQKELNRVIDIVKNCRIYAPLASKVNDPFEGTAVTFAPNWAGGSIYPNAGLTPPILDDAMSQFRLLSLTEVYDSPQMWAHYASSYSGVCVCVKTKHIVCSLKPVRYVSSPMRLGPRYGEDYDTAKRALEESAWFAKQRDWAYEQEWRVVYPCNDGGSEYVELGESGVAAVVLGVNLEKEHIDVIRWHCRKAQIPVFKVYIESWNLRMRIVPADFEPTLDGSMIDDQIGRYCYKEGVEPFERITGIVPWVIIQNSFTMNPREKELT